MKKNWSGNSKEQIMFKHFRRIMNWADKKGRDGFINGNNSVTQILEDYEDFSYPIENNELSYKGENLSKSSKNYRISEVNTEQLTKTEKLNLNPFKQFRGGVI